MVRNHLQWHSWIGYRSTEHVFCCSAPHTLFQPYQVAASWWQSEHFVRKFCRIFEGHLEELCLQNTYVAYIKHQTMHTAPFVKSTVSHRLCEGSTQWNNNFPTSKPSLEQVKSGALSFITMLVLFLMGKYGLHCCTAGWKLGYKADNSAWCKIWPVYV